MQSDDTYRRIRRAHTFHVELDLFAAQFGGFQMPVRELFLDLVLLPLHHGHTVIISHAVDERNNFPRGTLLDSLGAA